MSLSDLVGVTYGPYPYRTDPEKVGEYAAVVGASPHDRHAPPSLAGALLFLVAPSLLSDQRATESTTSVIHGDQSFTWHGPIPLGVELTVTGTVTKARERGGVWFTGFDLEVAHDGRAVVSGSSGFLMSGAGAAPAGGEAERHEPAPGEGSDRVVDGSFGAAPTQVARFAASRADLVRYAGASRDWNAIHWDHDAAVAAGLPGVVVHGLLQSAWIVETVARLVGPPVAARFRYRRPLGAAVTAQLIGHVSEETAVVELGDDGGAYVAATVTTRPARERPLTA